MPMISLSLLSLLLAAPTLSYVVPRNLIQRGLSADEICELPFTGIDAATAKSTWEDSGAKDFLHNFISDHGAEQWTNKFFEQVLHLGGSPYNCVAYPGGNLCDTPENNDCRRYDPVESYFVHQQIGMLSSSFDRIHESIQNDMIHALLKLIKDAVAMFGPPPPDDSGYIITMMIGAFVGAAAFAPSWHVAAPLTAVVGGLNWAAGINSAAAKPQTPEDFENMTEEAVDGMFSGIEDAIKKTVAAIFGGDLATIGVTDNAADWISDKFADGKMLDNEQINPHIDGYTNATLKLIKQGMVVTCLKGGDYYVWENWDKTEDECAENDYTVWLNNRCCSIAKDEGATMTGFFPNVMSEDKRKSFTDDYGFDYAEAMQNAIDCAKNGGGNPDWSKIPDFDADRNKLPPCFVNLEVKDQNFYKLPPGSDNGGNTDDGTWKDGWCGLHVTQYEKDDDHPNFRFDVQVKDANGKVIGSVEKVDAPDGKGIDVTSKLPWVVIVTADADDESVVLMDYAGQHWGSNDQEHHCDFGKYDGGNRDGDCGFSC